MLGAAEHARAVDCFEVATAREPQSAEAWAGLSLLTTDAWAHGFAGQGGKMSVLERAREMARQAMDIDGENLHSNLALAGAQFMSGADFRDVAERVLKAWPENAEAHGYIGALFVLSGETRLGSALVEEAIEWTPEVPSGCYATRSLVALREQRYVDALAAALRIDSPDWALGHLIVAAAAALGGRHDLAARARMRLIELDPTTATSRADVLRRWRVEPVLAAELERGSRPRRGPRPTSPSLAVLSGQIVDQALELEREVVELRHGHARELHELDELLEALRSPRSVVAANVPALTCSVSRVLNGPSRRRSASDSNVTAAAGWVSPGS